MKVYWFPLERRYRGVYTSK